MSDTEGDERSSEEEDEEEGPFGHGTPGSDKLASRGGADGEESPVGMKQEIQETEAPERKETGSVSDEDIPGVHRSKRRRIRVQRPEGDLGWGDEGDGDEDEGKPQRMGRADLEALMAEETSTHAQDKPACTGGDDVTESDSKEGEPSVAVVGGRIKTPFLLRHQLREYQQQVRLNEMK